MNDSVQKQKDKRGVMKYGGRDYAVGLLWLTAEGEEENIKDTKRKARNLKADFYANRDTVVNQFGFGYLEQGHSRGMPAGASAAADIMVGEWHGVFQAENGWWYLAVHADAIAPDGDMLFESEDDAYQHFIHQSEISRWPRTYVPKHWEFPENSGEVSLDTLFDDIPGAKLQPANMDAIFGGRRNKDIAVIMAVILGGILMLGTLASQILPSLLPAPRNPVQNVSVAGDLIAPPKPDIGQESPILTMDEYNLPTPSFVILACLRGMEDIVLPLPNWQIDKVQCDGRIVSASWKARGGNLDSIRPYITRFGTGVTHTFDGSGTFTATKLLPSLQNYKEQIVPLERDRAILMVNNRFGGLGGLKVEYRVPNQKKAANNAANPRTRGRSIRTIVTNTQEEEKPPFLDIELITNTPPTKTAEYFNIPGLSFAMIQYDLQKQSWTYEANIVLKVGDK